MREAICSLHGHDLLLHFESQRICLECSSCGHQTPGWQLAATRRPARIVKALHRNADLVMGSVAERVVRKAPCPVLTLRATEGSETREKPAAA
jgi:hypothetical protein